MVKLLGLSKCFLMNLVRHSSLCGFITKTLQMLFIIGISVNMCGIMIWSLWNSCKLDSRPWITNEWTISRWRWYITVWIGIKRYKVCIITHSGDRNKKMQICWYVSYHIMAWLKKISLLYYTFCCFDSRARNTFQQNFAPKEI